MDEYIYVRIAYALLLLVFLFCGCLRCCNLWGFPAARMAHVYPAKREAAAAYFSVSMLLPCLAYPFGTVDTWTFVRCFWILYVPAAASLALRQFFFKDINSKEKYLRITAVGGIPVAVLVVLFSFACFGGSTFGACRWLIYAVAVLALLLSAYMVYVLVALCRMAQTASVEDSYIFPRRFCVAISGITLAGSGMAWAVFIVDTPRMYAAIAVMALLAGMGTLITILHPQAKTLPGRLRVREFSSSEKNVRKNILSDAQLESIERQIRQIVETEKLYLDPDLKRDTLKERLEINRSYLSEVFTRRFGSLNSYLNLLRIEYAMRYAAEHPNVKLTEVARISGFGSMNTFYRAKRQYEKGN